MWPGGGEGACLCITRYNILFRKRVKRRPISGQFVLRGQELPTAYVHAKLEDRSFFSQPMLTPNDHPLPMRPNSL